mmetsp:Transcript_58955/g.117129  ORF Transcript_58955/g.117129 Transcript_58955/m.117129 type:complete len:233 (-) Transcript_58955:8253-8951(-)
MLPRPASSASSSFAPWRAGSDCPESDCRRHTGSREGSRTARMYLAGRFPSVLSRSTHCCCQLAPVTLSVAKSVGGRAMMAWNCDDHMKLKERGTRRSKKASDSCSSSLPMQRHAARMAGGRMPSGSARTRSAAVAAQEKPCSTTEEKAAVAAATSPFVMVAPCARPCATMLSMAATKSGTCTSLYSYGSPQQPCDLSVPRACTRTQTSPAAASGRNVASSAPVVMKETGYGA